MGRVVPDVTFEVHDGGDAHAGPDLAAEAVGFGPRCRSSGRPTDWSADKRRAGPGGGRAGGPLGLARARVIHSLTAASLTPIASAIWRWDPPCCRSAHAWRRRAAFQW